MVASGLLQAFQNARELVGVGRHNIRETMLHWGRKGSAEEEAEVDDDDDNVTTIVILDIVGDLNVVASGHRETNALKLIVVTYVKEIQT